MFLRLFNRFAPQLAGQFSIGTPYEDANGLFAGYANGRLSLYRNGPGFDWDELAKWKIKDIVEGQQATLSFKRDNVDNSATVVCGVGVDSDSGFVGVGINSRSTGVAQRLVWTGGQSPAFSALTQQDEMKIDFVMRGGQINFLSKTVFTGKNGATNLDLSTSPPAPVSVSNPRLIFFAGINDNTAPSSITDAAVSGYFSTMGWS